jgi:very-short-patch-repair endonuclease
MKEVHGDAVKYDKSTYVSMNKVMRMECPVHGTFYRAPLVHIAAKTNCPMCCPTRTLTFEEFTEKANKVHGGKYLYNDTNYVNNRTRIGITCKKHGVFYQTPNDHLDGCGCPRCHSSLMEQKVANSLDELGIKYVRQDNSFVKPLYLDFYIPSRNIAIECQGEQHFEVVERFGGYDKLLANQERDKEKKRLCEEHGVELVYLLDEGYNEFMDEGDVYFNDVGKMVVYIADKPTILEELSKPSDG